MAKETFLQQTRISFPIETTNAKKVRGCEAKNHNPSCPCLVCRKPQEDCRKCPNPTKQHVIPKCIAKNILRWTEKQIDDPSNVISLSRPCHADADKGVAEQYYTLRKEAENGKRCTPEDMLVFREQSS